MSKKLALCLFFIVLIPLILLGWLGLKVSYQDHKQVKQNMLHLLQNRLEDTGSQIQIALKNVEREFLKHFDGSNHSPEGLEQLQDKLPLVRQVFFVGQKGALLYPNPKGALTEEEKSFITRTKSIWDGKAILQKSQRAREASILPNSSQKPKGDTLQNLASQQAHGWLVWYWAEGMHLLFWKRLANKKLIGVEVDRIVLMSRLISALPDTAQLKKKAYKIKGKGTNSQKQSGRFVLSNARGLPIYQWGHFTVKKAEKPIARINLQYPLHFWDMSYFGPERAQMKQASGRIVMNVMFLVSFAAIFLLLLAFYLYREYARDMREAAQRVSFVTQVSHELKTPLTNILLYAELLENRLPEDDARANRHIHVIQSESQRLSRLISNILMFAKQRKNKLKLSRKKIDVENTIQKILERFAPCMASKDIELVAQPGPPKWIYVDEDAAEQILCNLFSNVEKYGAEGRYLEVICHQNPEETHILVKDRGPGVPKHLQETIFQPFVRGSDKLSDGVTGTGIGLTIARELARLMDGELQLLPSDEGACFQWSIPTVSSEKV